MPKLSQGIGKCIAEAVYQLVLNWDVAHKVNGMCFDTTAANTGRKSSACKTIQKNYKVFDILQNYL